MSMAVWRQKLRKESYRPYDHKFVKKNTWRILATIFITNGDDCLIEHKFDILTRKAMNPWNINNMNMEGGVLYRIMHYWVSKYTKR